MNPVIIYILIAVAVSFVFTTLALVDIMLKDFGSPRTKAVWHLVAIVPLIGWLAYLFFGYRKGRRRKPE